MEYYFSYVKKILLILCSFMVFGVISLFLIGYTEYLLGWVWGSLGNIVYFILLALRVRKLELMDPILAEREIKVSLAGRMGVIAFFMIVAVSVPAINILATLLGLISLKVAIYTEALLRSKG